MILPQPSKKDFHTFFDIVNLLAGFEHANFQKTGFDLFPNIPRPTPEVQRVMAWIHSVITEPEVLNVSNTNNTGVITITKAPAPVITITKAPPDPVKAKPVPWNKGLKKDKTSVPSSKAGAKKVVGKVAAKVVGPKVTAPEELPPTTLNPGKPFDYAAEVPDLPILVDDK